MPGGFIRRPCENTQERPSCEDREELCCYKPRNTKDCWQPLEARSVKKFFLPRALEAQGLTP